ncbi:MAG: hypothetical protein U0V73_11880 [Acidimicrobiia bacterium]
MLVTSVLALGHAPMAFPADGSVDPGFGTNGTAITALPAVGGVTAGITAADGSVVVAGITGSHGWIARFGANGHLRTSFGTNGVANVTIGSDNDEPIGLALDTHGRILVTGDASDDPGHGPMVLYRLTAAGTLDPTFGTAGVVRGSVANSGGSSVAVQPDGRIMVAGREGNDARVWRFTSDGAPDASFGAGGVVDANLPSSVRAEADRAVVLGDGRIVVAGGADDGTTLMFVHRYRNDGTLDPTFGSAGTLTFHAGDAPSVSDVQVSPAGHVFVLARDDVHFIVAKVTTTGSLDASFGTGGITTTDFSPNGAKGFSLVLQNDGKPVVTGFSFGAGGVKARAVRFTPGGAVDTGFGTDGVVTVAVGDMAIGMTIRVLPDAHYFLIGAEVTGGQWGVFFTRLNGAAGPGVPPPRNVVASAGVGTASVSWSAPSEAGPAPLAYVVTPCDGEPVMVSVTTHSTAVTDLPAGTTCQFGVHSVSENGASATVHSNPVVVLGTPTSQAAPPPEGGGHILAYRLVAADGGVFAFGGATFEGSLAGGRLRGPVVGAAATPTGQGYWLAASDGGVFAFGDAGFAGSLADRTLNRHIVGITATPTGQGYWLASSDGGVFAFGDAGFAGSLADRTLNRPVTGVLAIGLDYALVAGDGGVFAFGAAPFRGSLPPMTLQGRVVGIMGG